MPTMQLSSGRTMRRVIVRLDGLLWRLSIDGVPHSAHLHEEQVLERASKLARDVGAALLLVPREPAATVHIGTHASPPEP
jgi:hypothetical protein